ncbi:MAG: hypothetical protein RBR42_05110 [Desulfomicrobium sp.]|nr:hypothetical protein [Desulfomicrobium sp.]NLV96896.1 hypothetical protein [Desulfovibrionales bacterium]
MTCKIQTKQRLYRGDTWVYAWLACYPGTKNPYDLSGVNARLHLRDLDDGLVLEATLGHGLIITPEDGRIDLRLDLPQDMTLGLYRYDLEITWDDGQVSTHGQQTVEILKDETHD